MDRILPYLIAFAGAFAATFVLTPLVRELNRRIGMVDKPDARRINKVPIPRGGGLAVVIGLIGSYLIFHSFSGLPAMCGISNAVFYKMCALGGGIALIGLADDRFSLRPIVKLAGQIVIAVLVWAWADLGFNDLWPDLPAWIDCLLTVFWLVGAMNAFNLIDGMDGLASGISLIAVVGMAGSLLMSGRAGATPFHFACAGALLAFLRYNFNPASVFLGDTGSMFLGFTVAALPLASHAPNSFLVSVGVPLLAMGVPIFDTSLAILRRSIRRLLGGGSGLMTADSDHLHHRILRAVGKNQRKAAWMLYAIAAGAVAIGLVGLSLEDRAAGLYIVALSVAVVIVFRDMARVELFDAGMLLGRMAHVQTNAGRRRLARLTVPFSVVTDLAILVGSYLIVCLALKLSFDRPMFRVILPVRVVAVFAALILARTYVTIWSRALVSNYLRLFCACLAGSLAGAAIVTFLPHASREGLMGITLAYSMLAFVLLAGVRLLRGLVRDVFYAIDCSRLVSRKDVSRVLVYGSGLRYRSFRRELVRTTAANNRIIVGLLDDDILLRGHYIGGIRVLGTLAQAPEIINRVNADHVVITCKISNEWMKVVRETLEPTGVKISTFLLEERDL